MQINLWTDNGATLSATALTDTQGNPVPGVTVDWYSDRNARVVKFSQVQNLSNSEGIAVTTVTSSQAFDVTVKASIPFSSHTAETITFTTRAFIFFTFFRKLLLPVKKKQLWRSYYVISREIR
ncbi:MAG: Ig-like domain-containing protein [Candidatus Malihini olakiniferum]